MLKFIKNFLCTNISQEYITSSLFISSDEADFDDFFQQIYDTRKFCKWFNFFPVVWINFDKRYLDIGCTGTIYFTLPPFSYSLTVVKVVPNEYIEFVSQRGLLKGKATMKFTRNEEGAIFEEPHILSGKNILIHKYYSWLLAPKHKPFMNWRYKFLKKNLNNETLEKNRGGL